RRVETLEFVRRLAQLAGDGLSVLLVVPQVRRGGLLGQFRDALLECVGVAHRLDLGERCAQRRKFGGKVGGHNWRFYRGHARRRGEARTQVTTASAQDRLRYVSVAKLPFRDTQIPQPGVGRGATEAPSPPG